MPIIAYQSFNATVSSSHDLRATSDQRFTRLTREHVTGEGHKALILPYDSRDIGTPVEGPANLVPIDTQRAPATKEVFGAQIALVWQNLKRALGAMPDVMVCGELDASNPDFQGVVSGPNVSVHAVPSKKACQSFTAISQSAVSSQIAFVGSGEGYVVYSIGLLNVLFVHVPNRDAKDQNSAAVFYKDIFASLPGKTIHVLIGDTNQTGLDFTIKTLNKVVGSNVYANATASAKVYKADNYNVVESGTNSTGTAMYDIAVYRTDLVTLKSPAIYISQSSNGMTVTDHCGLGVHVELK